MPRATCKLWFTHHNEFFWSVDSDIWFTPSMWLLNMTRWFRIHSFKNGESSHHYHAYKQNIPYSKILIKLQFVRQSIRNTHETMPLKNSTNKKWYNYCRDIQLLERNAEMTRRWQMSIAHPTQSGGGPHQIIPHLKNLRKQKRGTGKNRELKKYVLATLIDAY